MNEDFTLTTFAEPITDLADEPQLPADEMKRRLQAPADELREAHNALAQTVHGITEATYPDTVTESMLTDELAAKINGKADADDVTALDDRLDTVETALPQKVECYFGTYTGNGASSRTISLGFTPSILITCLSTGILGTISGYEYSYGGICTPDHPVAASSSSTPAVKIVENGFQVAQNDNYSLRANMSNRQYYYIAFC